MEKNKTGNISEKYNHIQNRLDDPYKLLHIWPKIGNNKAVLKSLEQKGLVSEKGAWKQHEIDQLQYNMKMIQDKNPNIDIIHVLYGIPSKEKYKILRDINFVPNMAYMIKRDLRMVNNKIQMQFVIQFGFKTGPLDAIEWSLLKNLALEYNKKWDIISKLMNRHPNTLSIKYNQNLFGNDINTGTWSVKETERLQQILSKVPHDKVDWLAVSDYVGTRSCLSCCRKWMRSLRQRKPEVNMTQVQKKALLIYLYHSGIIDENYVDWQELVQLFKFKFGKNKITFQWNKLIETVPIEKRETFRMMITFLYKELCLVADQIKPKINFDNISNSVKIKRSPHWLRAMFLLLRNEIPENKNMSTENIIIALEKKYFIEPISKNLIVSQSKDTDSNLENLNVGTEGNNQAYDTFPIESDTDNIVHSHDTHSLDTWPVSTTHKKIKPLKRKMHELMCNNSVASTIDIYKNRSHDNANINSNVKRKKRCKLKQFQDLTRDNNEYHVISIDD